MVNKPMNAVTKAKLDSSRDIDALNIDDLASKREGCELVTAPSIKRDHSVLKDTTHVLALTPHKYNDMIPAATERTVL